MNAAKEREQSKQKLFRHDVKERREVITEMSRKSDRTVDRTDKYRVQLDFSRKAVAELDELKEILGASTRADVVRNALRWLFWCAEQVSRGATILSEQNGKQREVVFPFVTKKRDTA